MKSRLKSVIMAAMAVVASVSCTKEDDGPKNDGNDNTPVEPTEFHFVVTTAEDSGDGPYTTMWSKADELAVFIGAIDNSLTAPTAVLTNQNEAGLTARFEGTVSGVAGNGTFMSFTPSSSFGGCHADSKVEIALNSTQKPGSATIDKSCDVRVAGPCEYTAADGEVTVNDLYLKRIFSVLKISLSGDETLNGEKVSSFRLTAPEGVVLAGRASVNLADAAISEWSIQESAVTAAYAENDAPVFGNETGTSVYFIVNPTTVQSGSELLFEAETDNYSIVRTVTLTEELVLPESRIAEISLELGEADCKRDVFTVKKDAFDVLTLMKNEAAHAIENIGNGCLLLGSIGNVARYNYLTKESEGITVEGSNWIWTITRVDENRVLLADKGGNCVHLLDLAANTSEKIVTGISEPLRACADAEGNLYVLLRGGYVYKYAGLSSENQQLVLDDSAHKDNGNFALRDMCFDNDGNLLVLGNCVIYCFAPGSSEADIIAGKPAQESTNDELHDYIGNAVDCRFVKGQAIFCDSKGYVWFNDAWNITRVFTKGKTGYKDGSIRIIQCPETANRKLGEIGQFCESPSDSGHEVLAAGWGNGNKTVYSINVEFRIP